jgi:two-component sensor histidine kinase
LFLSFYELQIADPSVHDLGKILEDGQNRIRVMALVHDMLHNGKTGELIEVKKFIKGISDTMILNARSSVNIENTIVCPALSFDLDTAIPLGLMLNELLTNTIKYAVFETNSLRITIILTQISKYNFCLEVIDNAKIIEQKSIIESSSSFGIRMIKLISKQMGGNFLFRNENYNHFIINFMSSEGLKQQL